MQQRIQWVDRCKMIGVFLIVLGHYLPSRDLLRIVIYSFHVPLFFALSGYVFQPKTNFSAFLFRKGKALIAAYFLFTVLSLPYYFFYDRAALASEVIRKIFFVDGLPIWNGPLWFLVTLFFVNVICFFACSIRSKHRLLFIAAIAALFLVAGWALDTYVKSFRCWFGMEKAVFLTPFFLMGYLLRQYQLVEKLRYTGAKTVGLLLLTAALSIIFDYKYPVDISIAAFRLNNYWGLVLTSVLGTLSVIGLGKLMKQPLQIENIRGFSVLVMCTHFIFPFQYQRYMTPTPIKSILLAFLTGGGVLSSLSPL